MKSLRKYILPLSVAYVMLFPPVVSAGASASPEPAATAQNDFATEISISVSGSHILIANSGQQSCHVIIYALTGQVVKNITANTGTTSIELPAGYYIVKCGNVTKRVVLR